MVFPVNPRESISGKVKSGAGFEGVCVVDLDVCIDDVEVMGTPVVVGGGCGKEE